MEISQEVYDAFRTFCLQGISEAQARRYAEAVEQTTAELAALHTELANVRATVTRLQRGLTLTLVLLSLVLGLVFTLLWKLLQP